MFQKRSQRRVESNICSDLVCVGSVCGPATLALCQVKQPTQWNPANVVSQNCGYLHFSNAGIIQSKRHPCWPARCSKVKWELQKILCNSILKTALLRGKKKVWICYLRSEKVTIATVLRSPSPHLTFPLLSFKTGCSNKWFPTKKVKKNKKTRLHSVFFFISLALFICYIAAISPMHFS